MIYGQHRADRFAVLMSPAFFKTRSVSCSPWYETEAEIEAGLEWGRQKPRLLRWVRRQMGRRLTSRERRCLELYFFRNMTYQQVAAATGTDPSSAYRAVARSLRKLRRAAARERLKKPAPDPKRERGL